MLAISIKEVDLGARIDPIMAATSLNLLNQRHNEKRKGEPGDRGFSEIFTRQAKEAGYEAKQC